MSREPSPPAPAAPGTDCNDAKGFAHPASGVGALLGFPADQSGDGPAAVEIMLPVRYAQSPLPGWRGAEEQARENGYQGLDAQDTWQEWSMEKADDADSDALHQPVSPPSGAAAAGDLFPVTAFRRAAVSASGPQSPADGPAANSAQPQPGVQRTGLEMPGVSLRRQDFPALSQPHNGAAASQAGVDQPAGLGSRPYGGADPSGPPAAAGMTLDTNLLDKLRRLVTDAEASRRDEARATQASEPIGLRYRSSGREGELAAADVSPSPVGQAGLLSVERATQDLAQQLEQLRRMVRHLAAQTSPPPAQQRDVRSPRELLPSRPAQPVVIVKRAASSSRTPRAFWERSHLGRLWLRFLR